MSKRFFQRLVAILLIVIVLFAETPGVLKDAIIILLSFGMFLSTFDIRRNKRQ